MVTVYVDVIEPGRAFVVADGHQARVGREGTRFYVEDADTEEVIGYARSYRQAADRLARQFGITDYEVVIDKE